MVANTSHHLLPPFPNDVQTAPLVSVSLAELEAGDGAESEAFFKACRQLGFFYLNMEGSPLGEKLVEDAEKLLLIEQEFFQRPNAEKEEYTRGKIDPFFGYRNNPIKVLDEDGKPRRNETYNMRKDDFLGNCPPLPCHQIVKDDWSVFVDYVHDCRAVVDLLITHLEVHLELPTGTLANLHRVNERSGDHVRFLQAAIQPFNEAQARTGEHTDFGTLTILFNWLGGLQIRSADKGEWVYVKPVPGSAVVNLGDALVKFTAGILRSNVHRVVPPPPPQDGRVRNSLVYFSRPEDAVVLRRLKGGIIDNQPQSETAEEEMTSSEWIYRRSLGDLSGVYTHNGGIESRKIVYAS